MTMNRRKSNNTKCSPALKPKPKSNCKQPKTKSCKGSRSPSVSPQQSETEISRSRSRSRSKSRSRSNSRSRSPSLTRKTSLETKDNTPSAPNYQLRTQDGASFKIYETDFLITFFIVGMLMLLFLFILSAWVRNTMTTSIEGLWCRFTVSWCFYSV